MKKLFIKLFSLIGFTPLTKYQKIKSEFEESEKEKNEILEFFNEPKKPEISSADFKKLVGNNNTGYSDWNLYWKEFYSNLYFSFYFKNITKHPDVLKEFFYQFSKFDWQKIELYMKSTNWYWQDNKVSPNVYELQDCVISLLYTALKNEPIGFEKSGCESGGFEIKIEKLKRDPDEIVKEIRYSVNIIFKKNN